MACFINMSQLVSDGSYYLPTAHHLHHLCHEVIHLCRISRWESRGGSWCGRCGGGRGHWGGGGGGGSSSLCRGGRGRSQGGRHRHARGVQPADYRKLATIIMFLVDQTEEMQFLLILYTLPQGAIIAVLSLSHMIYFLCHIWYIVFVIYHDILSWSHIMIYCLCHISRYTR